MTLKEAVYRISRYRAFNPAGRFLYFLCERILVRTFLGIPEIRSAYVSGSMSGGDIVPGLSDIDCVVTIEDMGPEEEYRLVTGLERKIRYRMPPFGKDKIGVHAVVYSAAEWELLGDLFLGKKTGRPRELFRKDEAARRLKLGPDVKGLHHLYKALWKIENLEDAIVRPGGGALERELRERLMGRIVATLDSALAETRGDAPPPGGYAGLRARIMKPGKALKETGEPEHAEMLAMLLHLFDIAARAGLGRADFAETGNPPADAAPEAGTIGDDLLRELPRVLAETPAYASGDCGALYARREDTDIFLYDQADYDISRRLVEFYKKQGDRGIRLMSEEVFGRLCFNFTEPVRFVGIRDGGERVLGGVRDYDSLLIHMYSLFPQMRSPRNFKCARRYEAFRGKALETLRACEAFGPGGQDSGAAWDREGMAGERKEGYDRFEDLRALSLALRARLRESISLKQAKGHG